MLLKINNFSDGTMIFVKKNRNSNWILISENDYQKSQNKFESSYVSSNASVEGIADNLATYYMLYGDINLINTEIEIYRSITREEIRETAKKYLNSNQRMILDYVPAKDKAQN